MDQVSHIESMADIIEKFLALRALTSARYCIPVILSEIAKWIEIEIK